MTIRARSMTIRAHLLLLAAFAALPVLVFAVLISIMLIDQQQRTFERGAIERSRAMMSAVDADLRGSVSTLNALGASRALAADDLGGFHESAVRVLATQPAWHNITLALPSGQKVMDVRAGLGAAIGRVLDWSSAEQVLKTGKPAIGSVARETAEAPPVVAVRVPVVRDGVVRYILTAQVKPQAFNALISEQQTPGDWAVAIIDGNGNFVAREPRRDPGEPASPAFRAESRRGREGWFRGATVDGHDTFTAYQRSSLADWAIGLAAPTEVVLGAAKETGWLLGFGVLAAVATALALAFVIGGRIVAPMKTLASLAGSVGEAPAVVQLPRTSVREVDAVGRALQRADNAIRERHLLDRREKDAIEAADRAKDEFIATLSHELRNPLAAITSAAAILRRNDLNSEVGRGAREVIDRQVGHMSRMIEDLLDLSRVVSGKTHLKLERFDLAALVCGVVDAWRAEGRTARHRVTAELTPAWVHADRTRMEQVLANLLDNALKFTARDRDIRVTVAPVGESVLLDVEDDGQGIAPDMLDRVFDPFVQNYQWMSRDEGGLGLGLALVKRLVESQEGTVSVASAGLGKGARFSVHLPRVEVDRADVHALALQRATPRSEARKRVLVIDDNDDARQSLAILLGFEGHETYEAANGALGADLARHVHPDIALIDIGLPDLSGYEVARRIRADLNGDVTLVAVTGYGQPEDQRRAFDAGFDAHLVKPVTVEQLNETLSAMQPQARLTASASD